MDRSDHDLWASARRGDHDAFREIYERHSSRVQNFALRRLRSIDDSEDVVLFAFTALWAQRERVQCDVERGLLPWLFTVARNHVADILVGRKRLPVPVGDWVSLRDLEVGIPFSAEIQQELRFLMDSLPAEDRRLAHLVWISGYTAAEVARANGSPASTVRSRLHRIRAVLDRQWRMLDEE